MTQEEAQKIIGGNIRQQRLLRKMSVNDLAEMMGLSPSYIGFIEKGQRGTKLETLIRFAGLFGMTLDDLVLNNKALYPYETFNKKGARIDKHALLMNLAYYISPEQLDFIIAVTKALSILE